MRQQEVISSLVEAKKDLFISVSNQIWEAAELGMKEFKSAGVLMGALEAEGFTVKKGLAGIPTAFKGVYGSGSPVIGFLGEFDALPNLNQEASCPEQKQTVPGGSGHGCGHNLLGAAALAGAVALKDYMEANHLSGTVVYFGCPGEEFGCGKAFMAREGCFDGLDCALTWHPFDITTTWSISSLANASVYFSFSGKTAHAAAAPHLGRSALDAAELMNVGVNFLREHVIPEARIHYAFNDVGGQAPNVVQDRAKLHYYIRAPKKSQVMELFDRVQKVAQGAAMMTETECTVKFKDGLCDYIPNRTLTRVMAEAMDEIGPVPFDQADIELAAKFQQNQPAGSANLLTFGGPAVAAKYKDNVVFDDILPYLESNLVMPGSTDVGDVSYVVPTAQFMAASCAVGTGTHTWQMTAQNHSEMGNKCLLTSGKYLALTALKLLEQPEVLKAAKAEHQESTGGVKYSAIFPDDIMPTLD